MTREEAGRRGREIAARARAQKSEYYTDGNTVRHIKPQNRITNPYISKDKNKNKNRQYFLFFSRKRIHLQMFICSDILIN